MPFATNVFGRFIPALAGNISLGLFQLVCETVHPRARGEHCCGQPSITANIGSSPRSRGTYGFTVTLHDDQRFIPALAGNIIFRLTGHRARPVHPRARGEHYLLDKVAGKLRGSSPRSRGTLLARQGGGEVARFIPALAGNMWRRRVTRPALAVHPRARGEHAGNDLGPIEGVGSSPRSRGTCLTDQTDASGVRFIPALAGNIWGRSMPIVPCTVHPRARGEHSPCSFITVSMDGSSPRSRGTLILSPQDFLAARFIPALAGNISSPPILTSTISVHPRARGEHHC